MAGPRKAKRRTRVDLAYGKIKDRILKNSYKAGQQVLEQDLAQRLGMSRTPVREALIRLEREGLVEILPRRGMRVLPISPDDMREIYEVLTVLEARAAARLAERRPAAAEISALIQAADDMDRSLAQDDLRGWAAADQKFHRKLLELSGNKRLAAMAATVADQVQRARMATLHLRPRPRQSNKDHRAVLQAILKGDAQKAHDRHRRHRLDAMEMLTGILAQHELSEL